MSMTRFRSYSELERLSTFDERYEYLRLDGQVGRSTFGFDRYINQNFYSSYEWKRVREQVIYRDDGCDLGVPGYEIHSGILIHHINPMRVDDVIHGAEWLIDPEYLITTTQRTHNAIHYSDISLLPKVVVARSPGDTRLW
jgi:hypothetical protein